MQIIQIQKRSDYAGKIQELDQIKRSLLLRKGISKEDKQLPRILSIGEKVMEHARFENLNKNIYRFCDNVLEKKMDITQSKILLIEIFLK